MYLASTPICLAQWMSAGAECLCLLHASQCSPELLKLGKCLQGCKWHMGEECTRCPNCLIMPALQLLRKISNHLEMVKGGHRHAQRCHLRCCWQRKKS